MSTRAGWQHLGSGWEFDVYVTPDGWAFRFPRRAEYASAFDESGEGEEIGVYNGREAT